MIWRARTTVQWQLGHFLAHTDLGLTPGIPYALLSPLEVTPECGAKCKP